MMPMVMTVSVTTVTVFSYKLYQATKKLLCTHPNSRCVRSANYAWRRVRIELHVHIRSEKIRTYIVRSSEPYQIEFEG